MQKVTKRNIALAIIFLLILVVVALLIGNFTFSYLGADIGEDVNNQGETTASGDTIIFSKGNDLSLHATTDNFNATSGNLTDTTNPSARLIASGETNNATATYYAGIKINENTFTYSSGTTADVILTVRDETGAILTASDDNALSYVTVTDASGTSISGFDITGKTGAFNISIEHPISTTSSTTGTTQTWTFTLTFVNHTYDQSINENATLDMEVVLQKDEIMITIADLCNDLTLSECITTQVYTGIDGENGLYYHDADLTNGAQDNSYRYSGANPNNYVCFGSDEESCPEDNLYRIIGVFNDQAKIIKATNYSNIRWTEDCNCLLGCMGNGGSEDYVFSPPDYCNDLSASLINTELNTNYYDNLSTNWQNFIATTPFQETKVALMLISDYQFSTLSSNWELSLSLYVNTIQDNWLYLGSGEWIDSAYCIDDSGNANDCTDDIYIQDVKNVRPVFYLNSYVQYIGGSGTSTDPFRIA